ncbi:B12-binding domain-containing radical SAM protein [Clostridium aestuarii]|uniref:B12-binding domain-containing radical SAM protein n=1 Tax=Clostridium aestuarii TaxID=338193 RepID=A0ABT4D1Y7_9CLOT|nr:B12-binding domain-containing radical SAM protein [Clostridium aestuarii]MCY6484657.1 B12-binding domain-containing radical SAM protein [Clostridium aestuarii]
MKKLKVVLVGVNAKFIHSNLAIRYLKEYTKELDYECDMIEFSINDRINRMLEKIVTLNLDMVVFSCYIWNIEIVKALAKLIKLVNKDIEIVFGGPEVSFDGREFLENNEGDYLIEGEGEEAFKQLIEFKIDGELLNIPGFYYKKEGKVFYGGIKKNMHINKVVFPYTNRDNLSNKIVYYEASRGCPFGCKYCLSSVDRKVRFKDIQKVKEELKFLIDKKVTLVKFVDRTFNCNEKFAMDIWKFLIEQDTETTFHFEISADILTNKEIELLSKAPEGRFQFEVGVQTTNNEILRNINRYVNFENIKEKVIEVKKLKNIKQHLDLIAGLPGEDFKSFKKSFNDIYSMKPEEIQLGFLKLLKGSPMIKEAEKWGMKYSPYPPYEVLSTKDISYDEILKLKKVEEMVDKYYNSGKFNSILKYFMMKFKMPFDFYYELGMFFAEKGYFDRKISATDYYKVFLEFNSEKLKDDNEVLKEIVKYDYLMFNKKNWIPNFLERYIEKEEIKRINRIICDNVHYIKKNKFYIEMFKIDILNFIETNKILKNNVCLLFDDQQNIIQDITQLI